MEKQAYYKRFFGHLKTITKHKIVVTSLCFRCGLIKQGLLHDLSKYSFTEFFSGVKYYQGFRSPIDAEKEDIGYSLGWLHHKGKNKHHWEYWCEKNYETRELYIIPLPINYLIESCCDRIAACKIYRKDKYTKDAAYDFLLNGRDRYFMGKENFDNYKILLSYLKEHTEKETLCLYRKIYKDFKKGKDIDLKKIFE